MDLSNQWDKFKVIAKLRQRQNLASRVGGMRPDLGSQTETIRNATA
jgi:hypothetical protein